MFVVVQGWVGGGMELLHFTVGCVCCGGRIVSWFSAPQEFELVRGKDKGLGCVHMSDLISCTEGAVVDVPTVFFKKWVE